MFVRRSAGAPGGASLPDGCDDVASLSKPFTPIELCEAIVRAEEVPVLTQAKSPGRSGGTDTKPATAKTVWDSSHAVEEPVQGLRVLVAEDNVVNQLVVKKMLESLGCAPTLVSNGKEALEQWANEQFDMILMDIQMPVMDGFEATRAIRECEAADQNRTRTPIVAVTANVMMGDEAACIEAGMDGYVAKPIDRTKLADELARLETGSRRH